MSDTLSSVYKELAALVASAEEDVNKATEGNKKAGQRARKVMQQIKAKAQLLRKLSLQIGKE